MSDKKEDKENVVAIKEEEYIEIKRMLNLMYDYITDKLDRYRQREDERLVDVYDMHQFLGMSERTIYRRVKDGLLKCHRLDDDGKMVFTIRDRKQAGYVLGISERSISRLIKEKKLISIKFENSRGRRILRDDVYAYRGREIDKVKNGKQK